MLNRVAQTQMPQSEPQNAAADILFQPISQQMARLRLVMRLICWGVVVYGVAGVSYLSAVRTEYAVPFTLMWLTCLIGVLTLLNVKAKGLPFGAMICLQHLLFYSFPFLVQNKSIDKYSNSTYLPAAIAFALFLLCFTGLCVVSRLLARPHKSRYPLFVQGRGLRKHVSSLALALLLFALALQILFFTGYYWLYGGVLAAKLYTIAKAVSVLAGLCGSFLGGLTLHSSPRLKLPFMVTLLALLVFLVSGTLLSAATAIIIGLWSGITAGVRRIPWTTIVVSFLLFAFLNQGKFVMRERYFGTYSPARRTISQLPAFYLEWAQASVDKINDLVDTRQALISTEDSGQNLFHRIDNLQNLLYVTDALTVQEKPTLQGSGYYSLPSVFLPRIFWEAKPRTHEGMVQLNLHFGRQQNRVDTDTTYVAWGLLPEAIGNLGMWFGPLGLGLILGGIAGWLEVWSAGKMIASIEGIVACMVLLTVLMSYEMTIGVLAAAIFQMVTIVFAGGLFIRSTAR